MLHSSAFEAYDPEYYQQTANVVADLLDGTIDEKIFMTPSEWAENVRYIPAQLSPQPGPFSFDDTPYWREVVDCFAPESDVHFVVVQKGAQVGATVSVLENLIGYSIDYKKTDSMIFATVDLDVTKLRMEQNVLPMLEHSGLTHLIQSNDPGSNRKQGATTKKVEWSGGGVLYPFGARSPGKMRSFSVPWLLRDEVSGWPLALKNDGDPMELTETRTNSFELTRKVLDLSTPLIEGSDVISKRFALGDQRYYMVPCVHCHTPQRLYFNGDRQRNQGGLVWKLKNGVIVPGTVEYECGHCGKHMINEHKSVIMPEGQWQPTAEPSQPDFRSYHLGAMYAPAFARTWESIARAWHKAWDEETKTPKDLEKLQVFYNNDLGLPFELKTNKLKFRDVSPHRRSEYRLGEVPNQHAMDHAGGPVELLTMSVDVQETWLAVAVFGWAPSRDNAGYACYLVDYWRIEGDCKSVDGKPWQELHDLIMTKEYTTDTRRYRIGGTMIDASFLPEVVYSFCSVFENNVVPVRGRDKPVKGAILKEFTMMESGTGVPYAAVTVDMYKDRWATSLKRQWNKIDPLPRDSFSAPIDLDDKPLKELTVEWKREERDPDTGKLRKVYWHRPGNARQELWDVLMYSTAGLEMIALQACRDLAGVNALVWSEFWPMAAKGLYWEQLPDRA
ncbi:phage terminase [Vibrio phage CKB-S1]|nr:phage terminase [Vibrio phage CKB-S1]